MQKYKISAPNFFCDNKNQKYGRRGGGEEGREMAAILDLLDTILINKA